MIMLYAGLRRGEVLALTGDDFKHGKIIVNKAVIFDGNRPVLSNVKTNASEREVPILDKISLLITGLKKEDIVFPSSKGVVCSETAFVCSWGNYMKALSAAVNVA